MAFHRNWRYDDYYAERLIWFMENDYGWKPYHFPDHIIGDEFALQWRNVKHYMKVIRRLVRQGEYTEAQFQKLINLLGNVAVENCSNIMSLTYKE